MASRKEQSIKKRTGPVADNSTPLTQANNDAPAQGRTLSREEIKAKMLQIADEVMDEYDEALRELAK
jgi:hypothetical protein